MRKERHDSWEPEHDRILTEVVLKHVESGSTQLNAFEEAGDLLNRTGRACGFRWNKVVRHHFVREMIEAKQRRKEFLRRDIPAPKHKKLFSPSEVFISANAASANPLQAVMDSFNNFITSVTNENAALIKENEALRNENETLRQDYGEFVNIMNRAKELVRTETGASPAPKFKMAKNGNLEPVKG